MLDCCVGFWIKFRHMLQNDNQLRLKEFSSVYSLRRERNDPVAVKVDPVASSLDWYWSGLT